MTPENLLMIVAITLGIVILRLWVYFKDTRRTKIIEFFERIGYHDIHDLIKVITSSHHPSGAIVAAHFEHPLRSLLKQYNVVFKKVEGGRYVAVIVSHKPMTYYFRELFRFVIFRSKYAEYKEMEGERLTKEHVFKAINFLLNSSKRHKLLVKSKMKLRHRFTNMQEISHFFEHEIDTSKLQNEAIEVKPYAKDFLLIERLEMSPVAV